MSFKADSGQLTYFLLFFFFKFPILHKGHKNKTTKAIPGLIIRITRLPMITVIISLVDETVVDIFVAFRVNNGFLCDNGA